MLKVSVSCSKFVFRGLCRKICTITSVFYRDVQKVVLFAFEKRTGAAMNGEQCAASSHGSGEPYEVWLEALYRYLASVIWVQSGESAHTRESAVSLSLCRCAR